MTNRSPSLRFITVIKTNPTWCKFMFSWSVIKCYPRLDRRPHPSPGFRPQATHEWMWITVHFIHCFHCGSSTPSSQVWAFPQPWWSHLFRLPLMEQGNSCYFISSTYDLHMMHLHANPPPLCIILLPLTLTQGSATRGSWATCLYFHTMLVDGPDESDIAEYKFKKHSGLLHQIN